jgi:predicted DNA-binding transcriptional regulator AlpA
MADAAPHRRDKPQRVLMNTAQAANYCGLGKGAFDRYRLQGKGPPFIQLENKRVFYDRDDLDAWLDSNRTDPTKPRRA